MARDGWTTLPEDQVDGVSPTWAAAAFAVGNAAASPKNARTVGAVIGPIPGSDSSSGSSPDRPAQ